MAFTFIIFAIDIFAIDDISLMLFHCQLFLRSDYAAAADITLPCHAFSSSMLPLLRFQS